MTLRITTGVFVSGVTRDGCQTCSRTCRRHWRADRSCARPQRVQPLRLRLLVEMKQGLTSPAGYCSRTMRDCVIFCRGYRIRLATAACARASSFGTALPRRLRMRPIGVSPRWSCCRALRPHP